MKGIAGKYTLIFLTTITIIFSGCDEENLDKEVIGDARPLTQEETFLVESSNQFAYSILKQSNELPNRNVSFSPISAGAALGIVGNTLPDRDFETFKAIVGLPDLPLSEINKAFYELSTMAPLLDESVELKFSNSLWTRYKISDVNDIYSKMLAYYNTDIMETYVDKTFEEKYINKWVQAKSDFNFYKIDNFNNSVPFQIINLSQFKGMLFNNEKASAITASFHDVDGVSHDIPMNHFANKEISVKKFDNVLAVEVPVGNGEFLLEIILSEDNNRIISNLDSEVFSEIKYNSITLPDIKSSYEFTFDKTFSQYNINSYLSLGIANHFPDSHLASTSTFLNKSNISISGNKRSNEDIEEVLGAINPETNFTINKPFYFLIKDRNSGLIVFEGRYNYPEI